MNIAIGVVIFEKGFWPWFVMKHTNRPIPGKISKDPLPDDPGICPICADGEGDCILNYKFEAKTVKSLKLSRAPSFKARIDIESSISGLNRMFICLTQLFQIYSIYKSSFKPGRND